MARKRNLTLGLTWLIFIFWSHVAAAIAQSPESVRLYFFTMQGCAPCAQVAPIVNEFVAAGYPIQTIDARLQPQWVQQFSVSSTPTFVMTIAGQEVGRHSGVLDVNAIRSWFERAIEHAKDSSSTTASGEAEIGTSRSWEQGNLKRFNRNEAEDTTRQGTRQPANEAEKRAMAGTVRLQVEDAEGISTATGTIIHSHRGESLVMTCGHVFRESKGRGVITADVGWLGDRPERVPGELVNYDAGPLDVALVILRTKTEVQAVPLGSLNLKVSQNDAVFSIGCDRNSPPTIRRTMISAISKCDNAEKYEIVGRPVMGRSGGGLFNERGELIGVCNAAFVEEDGGLYSSLANIHQQIHRASLAHLFQQTIPRSSVLDVAQVDSSPQHPATSLDLVPISSDQDSLSASPFTAVQNLTPESEFEAIVILRSKNASSAVKTVVVENPTVQFLQELEALGNHAPSDRESRIAQLRMEMPRPRFPNERESANVRAQSPR